jgi:aspartokinase
MATLAVLNQLKGKYPLQKRAPTLVMKFGGTSVGTADAMRQAAKIVAQARPGWPQLVVIVSALSGVTNRLLDSAQGAVRGEVQDCAETECRLREDHYAIADDLLSNPKRNDAVKSEIDHLLADFLNLCRAVGVLGEASPRALDAIASLGERMSVRLMAAVLQEGGLPAQVVEASPDRYRRSLLRRIPISNHRSSRRRCCNPFDQGHPGCDGFYRCHAGGWSPPWVEAATIRQAS